MSVDSFKHNQDTRPLIPSSEEAGAETASPLVQQGKTIAEFPRNPIVNRGQDPELFWMQKYDNDDRDELLKVDIRALYRHEHIQPDKMIERLFQIHEPPSDQLGLLDMFDNYRKMDEFEKISGYYEHQDDWENRLIQGDSLLVMTSLLERERLAGKVQCIYIDPPYGIKYGSNWQIRLNSRNMNDNDESLSGEPEQIKAFRDTWELGVHSYLSYLRDRLLIAHDLLSLSGSCFVQISDENMHLVRSIMDEIFGSENFIAQITVQKTTSSTNPFLSGVADFILWYGRDKANLKYRELYKLKEFGGDGASHYNMVELPDGQRRSITREEREDPSLLSEGSRFFTCSDLQSASVGREKGEGAACWFEVSINGRNFLPNIKSRWKTNEEGMKRLIEANRVVAQQTALRYVRYFDDFPAFPLNNIWVDLGGAADRLYVVQTNRRVIERCILMTTDPGDIVLDPTCGSGTTAYIAEQWGRRWITIDTSRIALNITKIRLITSTFPYYRLHDNQGQDIRQGFIYKIVPHIKLEDIANAEPPIQETLYDQPEIDHKRLRVSGPFTVETLQNFEPASPSLLDKDMPDVEELEQFEEHVFEYLRSAGVRNGFRNECAVFTRLDRLNHAFLHVEGFYQSATGEKKAYLHIGPKFGTVSRQAVNEAIRECRLRGDADWLIILGFSFESDISTGSVTTSMGTFEVTKNRMHDDLMQDGLKKHDKKAASFVTIGEPDIRLHRDGNSATVEICGLDIYDPIKDEVKARNVADIAYWMVDDNYDGSNFIVRQVFFCGGDKDEFDDWKKGLSRLAEASAKKKAEKTLKIEIDDDAFSRLYGFQSHPISITHPTPKIAVGVISQFGEESTKILEV
ncbi:MAG: site-specific DNA-methyltransferase [Armatimonadota bacterium]